MEMFNACSTAHPLCQETLTCLGAEFNLLALPLCPLILEVGAHTGRCIVVLIFDEAHVVSVWPPWKRIAVPVLARSRLCGPVLIHHLRLADIDQGPI